MSGKEYEISNFDEDVISASKDKPIVVDFWAPWCGPCKMLGPTLEKALEDNDDQWELKKVNVDNHQELARRYNIRGIPAVMLFHEGEVVDQFTGVIPEDAFNEWVGKHLPDESKKRLGEINELISLGEIETAETRLREIIEAEPDNEGARVLLGKLVFHKEPITAYDLTRNINEFSDHYDEAQAIFVLSDLLKKAMEPSKLPDHEVKETYLEGIQDVKERNWSEALERFIEVINKNKKYDDEGARKGCIAIFNLLGRDHEVTHQFRRKFDMALY